MIGMILQRLLEPDLGADIKDPAAKTFFKRFGERREDVVDRYFHYFNDSVFDNQLPVDIEVVWKNRLLKTAGFCIQDFKDDERHCHIELATKVCDTPDRIRDVLIHEMCHAAAWIIDGVRDCHGPGWKTWADRANYMHHGEISPVSAYHDYKIATKYIYRCKRCNLQTGRHSKSLDVDSFVCAHCDGRIELLRMSRGDSARQRPTTALPRRPSTFAVFVRDNFRRMKRRHRHLSSKEIMRRLSDEFAKKTKAEDESAKRGNYGKKSRKRGQLSTKEVTEVSRSEPVIISRQPSEELWKDSSSDSAMDSSAVESSD